MSNPNGFGADIAWEHRGRRKKAASPVSSSSPAGDEVGTGIAKGTFIDPRYILGACLAVIGLVSMLFLFFSIATASPAPDQATPAPTPAPVSTPIPTESKGQAFIKMVDQLLLERQYAAAARMAEKALKTVHLTSSERKTLQERALTANLHFLLSQPVSVLNVPAQQQVIARYTYLKQQAAAAGIPFPTNLEGATLATAGNTNKLLLAKTLLEQAYRAGEFTKADQDTLRLYSDVLCRLGWWYAQGTDATKAEGVRYLVASHALDVERGIAKGQAWAELQKFCNPDKRTCPDPIATPLLGNTH